MDAPHPYDDTIMNFGAGPALLQLAFLLVIWGIPLVLLVWFIRILTAMARRLGDIVSRLDSLERAIQDANRPAPRSER